MEYPELRRLLSRATRELYREKLFTAAGGNLSVKLPGRKGFLITPGGLYKGNLKPESMVELDDRGRPVSAGSALPSIETSLHLQIYRLNPSVEAVAHTHAPSAIIAGLYNLNILPLTVEMIRFMETPLIPFFLPGSTELAAAVASALENNPSAQAIMMQNHGLVSFGPNLRAAINTTLALEEACRVTILCRLLDGKPSQISKENCLQFKQWLNL